MKITDKTVSLKLQNTWVALKPDNEVVASAPSIKELEAKLVKLKAKNVSLMYVTSPNQFLTPYACY